MLLNWFPLWLGHGDKLWLNLVKRMGAISSLTLSGSLFRPLRETEVIVLVAVQFCFLLLLGPLESSYCVLLSEACYLDFLKPCSYTFSFSILVYLKPSCVFKLTITNS